MKIFIDGIIFSLQRYGGISVYFLELLSHLKYKHVEFELMVSSDCALDFSQWSQVDAITYHKKRFLERYRDSLLKSNVGIFHSSYYRVPSCRGLKTVVTVHDFVYEKYISGFKKTIHSIQKNKAIKSADAIICISESTHADLLDFVGVSSDQQVHVIHNGVSSDFRPVHKKLPIHRPYLLYVGARSGYKNFQLLLAALKILPEFDLICVGGGKFKSDELKQCDSQTFMRIKALDFVDNLELNLLYNNAFCLVYPSKYEGFGIPVLEAMKAGCPVVSVDCRAVKEIGGDALVIAYQESVDSLAESIRTLHSSFLRQKIVFRGLARSQLYSWSSTHDKTLGVYSSLK